LSAAAMHQSYRRRSMAGLLAASPAIVHPQN
jgi:hypothetical protein